MPKRKTKKGGPGVMNIILIVVGIALFAFTVKMIQVYEVCGSVPDSLITCVFAALGGECGIMGWIKTSKERNRDRDWEVADRKAAKRKNDVAQPPDDSQGGIL